MTKNAFFVAGIIFMLFGCVAMDKLAGLGVVTQKTSTFDNATVIDVSPNSLYDPGSMWGTRLQLGARWSSATPNVVALILSYKSNVSSGSPVYLGLLALDINIEGKISSYSAKQPTHLSNSGYNSVSSTIYTSSKNAIVIPYPTLELMVAANSCKLRLHTNDGYQDVDFSTQHIPGGKATAIVSIKEFMLKVAAARANI